MPTGNAKNVLPVDAPAFQEAVSQWIAGCFSIGMPDELKSAPYGWESMPHFHTTATSGLDADVYVGDAVIYYTNPGLHGEKVWWDMGPVPDDVIPKS